MSKPPELSAQDIRAEVEELYGAGRGHHLFAFYGTGSDDAVQTDSAGPVLVRPVQSELELRERVAECDEAARVVFLVPWTEDIPLDLAGRFALLGRVQRIGNESRLKRMFDAQQVDEEALLSPLAAYLLEHPPSGPLNLASGRLTEAELWAGWLERDAQIPLGVEPAVDSLLGWAAYDGRGPAWCARLGSAGAVRQGLVDYLRPRLGLVGVEAWKAWERGQGAALLELGLAFDAIALEQDPLFAFWRRMKVKAELGVTDEAEAESIGRGLAHAAGSAFRSYQRYYASSAQARTLLERAEARVDDSTVRLALGKSTRLPSGWQLRLDAVGKALSEGARLRSPAAVSEAKRLVDALDEHVQGHDEEHAPTRRRATMAVRLLAWLAARTDRQLEGPPSSFSDAELLGRWYAEEGGYVDWARSYARGPIGGSALDAGIAAVVEVADGERQALDRRYAEGLQAWCEAGRPIRQLLPIERALERIAVPFLDADEEHLLLVLLIDGMAWAQAAEILSSLAGRAVPWGPLRWHQRAAGKIGDGAVPVVVSALPSETEVSRAAFFAGKLVDDGFREPTKKDVERFAAHKALAKYFEGAAAPQLMLRSEGHTSAGDASVPALTLVRDVSQRIVALVINAIDSSLKGDPQHQAVWNVEAIKSLGPLLEAAREVGRSVLLASDHGHVPASRFVACKRETAGGGRWREWHRPDEALAEGELGFRGDGVHIPKGAHGVVLWTDDAHRYGGSTHAGDHGGATLAETITPCFLIGPDGMADELSARGATRGHVPSWWVFDVREPVELAAEAPVIREAAPRGKRGKDNPNQLSLLDGRGEAPAVALPKAASLAGALVDSELLRAREPNAERRALVLKAVDFLLASGNIASREDFAGALGSLPARVEGLVSTVIASALNVDGYNLVWFDHAGQQVRLDKGKLEMIFEVKL